MGAQMTDPITLADEAEEQWLANTRRLLVEARDERSDAKLRRCGIRLDSHHCTALHRDIQDELWLSYAEAMQATGVMFP